MKYQNNKDLAEAQYYLKMLDDFSQVFNAKNKANDEIIFAIRFLEGEATNSNGTFTYNVGTGSTKNRYQANGEVFGDALDIQNTGNQTYEYNKAVYQNDKISHGDDI